MKAFRDVLDKCGFMDLGYVGGKFTWKGKRPGGLVLKRLDRVVATNGWFSLNPGTKVQHLPTHSPDHKAILIKLEGIAPRLNCPFKFEQMWLCDKGCNDTVNATWGTTSQNATMVLIVGKIKICGEKLSNWSHQSFGCIKKQIEIKGKMLSKAKIVAAKGEVNYKVVKSLRAEVNNLLVKESQMWQQRSRALFLKCGDRNTSYFHSKALHRFRRNMISGLRNSSNAWCTEDSQIKDIAYDYYHSLFTLSHPAEFFEVM